MLPHSLIKLNFLSMTNHIYWQLTMTELKLPLVEAVSHSCDTAVYSVVFINFDWRFVPGWE